MKTIHYITFAAICAIFSSCDYLNEEPYHYLKPETSLVAEAHFPKPTNESYKYIFAGFNCVNGSYLDCATDDGVSTISTSNVHKLAQGFISEDNTIYSPWAGAYNGIRQCLYAEDGLRTYKVHLTGKTDEATQLTVDQYYYENVCLRAYYEFTLLQFYGGFPIVDKLYYLDEENVVNEKKRDNYADCVEHIVALCDSAATHLYVKAHNDNTQMGRMTKGAALAIKAKTLIYAASPLANRAGNTNPLLGYTEKTVPSDYPDLESRWKRAAKACADVMNLNTNGTIAKTGTKQYSLIACANSDAYNKSIFNADASCAEFILFKTQAKSNSLENRQYPPSVSKNSGGCVSPTQELINEFTASNGADCAIPENGTPTVYTNRDRRFAAFITYEGAKNGKATIYTHTGDGATKDALNATKNLSTTTGYYLLKFLTPGINWTAASVTNPCHNWPIIRLADIYLLYAEAMVNGYGDFNVDPEGYGHTAKSALQAIRTRAGFNANTDLYLSGITDVDGFMKALKRERRIELCFEGQRYHDLRRWLDAETVLNKPVHGIEINKQGSSTSYTYFEADSRRTFTEKMYYHPIPKNVLKVNTNIEQNPGY